MRGAEERASTGRLRRRCESEPPIPVCYNRDCIFPVLIRQEKRVNGSCRNYINCAEQQCPIELGRAAAAPEPGRVLHPWMGRRRCAGPWVVCGFICRCLAG